jgi:hypothetical protein
MRRLLATALVLLLADSLCAGRARGSVEIAPLDEAITFARAATEAGPRVIAVTRYTDGVVSGVDLSTLLGGPAGDPIDALREHGWETLRDRIAGAPQTAMVTTPADGLDLPVDLRDHHIAAGTNYPEHAGEAEVEDGPFLFAKLVRPTGPRAPVSAGDALLDYEVEIAFVTLEPLVESEAPASLGLGASRDSCPSAISSSCRATCAASPRCSICSFR